ncbi:MAG: helix-turn-helix transcriptional regulator [Patescibacteria group bacterium]
MTIKNNLKIVRKNKKLTQREVARRANLSLMGYIKIERGESIPNLSNAFRIAKAIGERLEKLFICKDKK